MDYSKMTKEQLINKLNEQVHLAQAVEAKDVEIARMQKALEISVKGNLELKEQAKGLITREQMDLATKKLLDERNSLVEIVKDYRMLFMNTLKNMQGGLDNAILSNELLSAKLGIGG